MLTHVSHPNRKVKKIMTLFKKLREEGKGLEQMAER